MFGPLTEWFDRAYEAVDNLTEQGAEMVRQTGLANLVNQFDSVGEADDGSASTGEEESKASSSGQKLSLEVVKRSPAAWSSSHEEWEFLICAALRSENFCSVTPAAATMRTNVWKEICHRLDMGDEDAKEAAAAAASRLYAPQPDIAEWLPTYEPAYAVYARLVPHVISDDGYWRNVGWKLGLCARSKDAVSLLSLVKTLSGNAEGERNDSNSGETAGQGVADKDAAHWEAAEAELRALQDRLRWHSELEATVMKEMELAGGNLKLLRNLTLQQDVRSDLAQSVAESCTYHKVKLAKLLGETEREQDRLVGSSLSADGTGKLYVALVEMNASFRDAMAFFEERQRGGGATGSSRATSPIALPKADPSAEGGVESVAAPAAATPTQSESHEKSGSPPSAPSHVPQSPSAATAGNDNAEDTSFEAKIPWEDDDHEGF